MFTQLPCYGEMFPDVVRLRITGASAGKVFSAKIERCGIGVQGTDIRLDKAQWDKCVACPDYRTCHDLCVAKLLVQQAVRTLG